MRQTLVSRRDDLDTFDRAFAAWFLRVSDRLPEREAEPPRRAGARRKGGAPGPGPELDGGEIEVGAWSADELLRTRDFAAMSPEEFARARVLIRQIALARPLRRTHRLRRDRRRGALDVRALVRSSLSTGGDPVHRAYRSRSTAPRKLVLLLDISGSMEAYARGLLLYLHAAQGSGRGVETFAFGTRLTRLTSELGLRDPDSALAAAAKRVVDWSGGTRIGESLKAYNDMWGRRALTRGAVVVILSDGCERGDADGDRRGDGAPRASGVRGRLGEPAQGPSRLRAARRRHAGGVSVRRPAALGPRHREPRGAGYSPRRHRTEARSVKDIAEGVERWRERGERIAVATVVATRRSAPRPIGAKFAVSEAGEMCGSVSGGCVENDVAVQALEVIASGEPRLLSYGISDEQALGVGLPCGGEIDVFLERLE